MEQRKRALVLITKDNTMSGFYKRTKGNTTAIRNKKDNSNKKNPRS